MTIPPVNPNIPNQTAIGHWENHFVAAETNQIQECSSHYQKTFTSPNQEERACTENSLDITSGATTTPNSYNKY